MAKYTVLAYPGNFPIKKALIAAAYGGIEDEIEYPPFNHGVDNKKEEFLQFSPLGKVPSLLITGTTNGIFESNAIARFIARVGNDAEGLLGKDALEQSIIDAWIDFVTLYVAQDSTNLFLFKFGKGTFNKELFAKALDQQRYAWKHLEDHFNRHNRKFLTNDRITLADIIMAVTIAPCITVALDQEFRSAYPKTEAYMRSLFEQEPIKKVFTGTPVKFNEQFDVPNN
jgi:elongation factor 1-gamma